jgi:hypothetical protein
MEIFLNFLCSVFLNGWTAYTRQNEGLLDALVKVAHSLTWLIGGMKIKTGVDFMENRGTKIMSRTLELIAKNEAQISTDSEVRQE